MARAEWTDEDNPGAGPHATAPDARLTTLIRADTSTAYPALRELRRRHRPAVLAYARLCAVDEPAARRLTAQAFALAARETARGVEPRGPWRHQLLLIVTRVAAAWATDDRGHRLDPGLLARLRATDADSPVPPMLAAFHSLPTRVQGIVWYGLVDEEPDAGAAVFLGFTPQDVEYGEESAFQTLRQACLRVRLPRSGDPRCQDFRRLIEEAVRPEHPRYGMDLDAHMAVCSACATAYEEQCALRDTPRTALADGLLIWGGAAYVTDRSVTSRPASRRSRTAVVAAAATTATTATWWPSRRFALASAALGVAVAPLLVYLLSSSGADPQRAANSVPTPAQPPAVTVTATVSATSSPSPSPTRTTKSPEPTTTSKPSDPTSSPKPSTTPRPSPPADNLPKPHPPNSRYAQVVNVDSGLCLDIHDGDLRLGTDVVMARCEASRTQMWRVDADRDVVQSYADPDYCLDSRGATDRGVGIWECRSVDGPNGTNLRFTVDESGALRPAIAPDHAVTPFGDRLALAPAQGRDDQRWKAGARPA
ncbi:ricin-type beta-trefoil lectin domain protein [Streptomyces montanus]|uniref:Ricin-type beta-trefoil lectin domain protein n=1 Tax=Streptomyces montanus TaxID=2580423 RepID=A0A5R9FIA6_9ACTN|nr:RICIN domain-containing protein [Streptomyces montanus]TLS41906.1 ricin-type beta-trefoil lectin domain protein [Streptomyces montanus]